MTDDPNDSPIMLPRDDLADLESVACGHCVLLLLWAVARNEALEAELAACQVKIGRLRSLCRSLEAARDERDAFERDLREIGRRLGCDHLQDGLARCVGQTIEQLEADLAAARRVCQAIEERNRASRG